MNIPEEAIKAVARVLKPWLYEDPHLVNGEWGAAERAKLESDVRDALGAATPLIAAQVLRSAAAEVEKAAENVAAEHGDAHGDGLQDGYIEVAHMLRELSRRPS